MKTIKILLLLSLSLIISSCSDDKKDNHELDSLTATSWEGEFIQEKDGEITRKGSIGIEFTTDNQGIFSLIYEDDSSLDYGTSFAYIVNPNLLVIHTGAGYASVLYGNWLVVSSKKNSMVLQKGLSNEGAQKDIMILKKAI